MLFFGLQCYKRKMLYFGLIKIQKLLYGFSMQDEVSDAIIGSTESMNLVSRLRIDTAVNDFFPAGVLDGNNFPRLFGIRSEDQGRVK